MGNPYPAIIDWQNIATKTNLTNSIWHQTSSTAGTTMVVDTWNGNSLIGTSNNGTSSVDGKISPIQAFWVQCTNVGLTGTLSIDESARTHDWGSSKFLKSSTNSGDKNLLRLYLYSNDKRDETIILQSESAQDNFDRWDSKKQSVKPIANNKMVNLGISVGTAGEYKFVANLSEVTSTDNIFLLDKQLNVTQDLMVNPEYTFTSGIVDDTSRFVIQYFQAPKIIANDPIAVC